MGAENRGKDRMNSRVGAGEKKPPIGREEEREGRKGHEGKHHKGKRYSAIRSKEKRRKKSKLCCSLGHMISISVHSL